MRWTRVIFFTAMLIPLSCWAEAPIDACQVNSKTLCRRALSEQDIKSLPTSVSNPFREPSNYDETDEGYVPKVSNNCISLGLDQWSKSDLSASSGLQALQNELSLRRNANPCQLGYELIAKNSALEVIPSNGRCDAASGWWQTVMLFKQGIGNEVHMIRQLDNGNFFQIEGDKRPISWLVSEGRIVNSISQLKDTQNTYKTICQPLCVRHRAQPSTETPVVENAGGTLTSSLRGKWIAVSPSSSVTPSSVTRGVPCGPYWQSIQLSVGLPPGWLGDLIPGYVEGPNSVALQILSNLVKPRDNFNYGGVNLLIVGTLPKTSRLNTIILDQFHDALFMQDGRGEVDHRTGQRIPPVVDPNGGLRLQLLGLTGNSLRIRVVGATICPTDLLFQRP